VLIARRIRATRLEQSWSIDALEAEAGLARGLLSRLEDGKDAPSMAMLEKLAEILGVPVCKFFFKSGEPLLTPWLAPRPSLEDLATKAGPGLTKTASLNRVAKLRGKLRKL